MRLSVLLIVREWFIASQVVFMWRIPRVRGGPKPASSLIHIRIWVGVVAAVAVVGAKTLTLWNEASLHEKALSLPLLFDTDPGFASWEVSHLPGLPPASPQLDSAFRIPGNKPCPCARWRDNKLRPVRSDPV